MMHDLLLSFSAIGLGGGGDSADWVYQKDAVACIVWHCGSGAACTPYQPNDLLDVGHLSKPLCRMSSSFSYTGNTTLSLRFRSPVIVAII